MYLLDTNVISQLAKREPNQGVIDFMQRAKRANARMYLSVLTIGEIRQGVAKLSQHRDTQQSVRLQQWMDGIKQDYADCLLPVDASVSELSGSLLALTDNTNAIDKLIAATALLYGLTLVTRNVSHVSDTGVNCLNPFSTHLG